MSEDTKNTEHNYWLVGYWGNKKDEFISQGKWEDGNSQEDIDKLKQVNVGDYLVLKSNITTGPNHSLSSTKIYAIGIVNKKNEDLTFCVKWYTRNLPETLLYSSFGGGGKARIANIDHIKILEKVKKYIEENIDPMKTICSKLLKESHNIILHGAPGTGKTYLAKQIAESMGAETCFVQFHPSYDYTDFVEGLRPVLGNETKEIGFERKDGIFKKFCSKALENLLSTKKDNFETIYKMFIDQISESAEPITYETEVQKKPFNVEVNSKDNIYAIPQTTSKTRMPITKESLKLYLRTGKIIDWKPYLTVLGQKMIDLGYQKQSDDIEKKNYVFIIDEINRGELSKIFGELFFSIDPGYRVSKSEIENHVNGVKKINTIKTQYSNMQQEPNEFDVALGFDDDCGHFFVPENVYIIGTMNDIDRNVESMDFAIRRRFAFKEITAEKTQGMLDNPESWNGNKPSDEIIKAMKKRMTNLNNAISGIEGLSSAYHIGAAYFLKYDSSFDELWDYHLKPLLQEYLRGMEDADNKLKALKAAYDNDKQ